MASIVQDVLTNGGIALIQAPTGTGKTYGYGVPAVLSDKRIIISTAKKALQQQIVDKDLPALVSRVAPRTFALLKGKGNYICKLRTQEFLEHGAARYNAKEVSDFERWLAETPSGELDGQWTFGTQTCVTECIKAACPIPEKECPYLQARQRFAAAQIGLVNHALLVRDIQTGGKILGAYDYLIVDEAHQLVDTFQDALSYELSEYFPERLLKAHDGVWGLDKPEHLKPVYHQIFEELEHLDDGELHPSQALARPVRDVRSLLSLTRSDVMDHLRTYVVWDNETNSIRLDQHELMNLGRDEYRAVVRSLHVVSMIDEATTALGHTLGTNPELERIQGLQNDGFMTQEQADVARAEAEKWKTSVITHLKRSTYGGRQTTAIRTDPLSVARRLGGFLRSKPGVVLTSATLSVGEDFGYLRKEFGLAKEDVKHEVNLPPVFNYPVQALTFIDDAMPKAEFFSDAARKSYYAALAKSIHELLEASEGGALVLLPSWTDLKGVAVNVADYKSDKYRIMTQSSPAHDIELFRSGMNNALFGVKSFWEGVDVPGMALRLVVITRLPFPPMNDAVIKRRKQIVIDRLMDSGMAESRAGMESFKEICVMPVALEVAQAVGRLIRSETDRGVVAMLDCRIGFGPNSARSYAHILRSVMPTKPTVNRELALEMLRLNASIAKRK